MTSVGVGDGPLAGVVLGVVRPASEQPGVVAYPRGALVEQYLAMENSIEQQFLIPQPLPLEGADLVIAGAVRSAGAFEETEEGWLWGNAQGAVRLGNVRVYDGSGRELPAAMTVTADDTRIVVAGRGLAGAAYPVIIDPEIGENDFRLSDMGPNGSADYTGFSPAVAYNSVDNEYLVVWVSDDNTAPQVEDEYEIFGQGVAAATGAEIGGDFRLSDMGPEGDTAYDLGAPEVAYNTAKDEYLVVWYGEDNIAPLVDDEREIFGQRLTKIQHLVYLPLVLK